jgi:predicted RNase H-like HicB family nuclease
MKTIIEIHIESDADKYHAYCPHFKGLHTWGETPEEVLLNFADVLKAYIMSMQKHRERVKLEGKS